MSEITSFYSPLPHLCHFSHSGLLDAPGAYQACTYFRCMHSGAFLLTTDLLLQIHLHGLLSQFWAGGVFALNYCMSVTSSPVLPFDLGKKALSGLSHFRVPSSDSPLPRQQRLCGAKLCCLIRAHSSLPTSGKCSEYPQFPDPKALSPYPRQCCQWAHSQA